MAPKKQKKKTETSKPIEIYKHKDKKRKNNPHVGVVTSKTENPKVKTKKYQYDPHLDPELQWAGKAEKLSFEVPSVPLHVHERIDPRSIIETVRSRNSVDYEQMSLFHDPKNKISPDKEAEFYKHEKLWANRMIAGDSLLVMNSLLEKEGMGGKIQCIYIDPPYGIKYGSNFQPFTNKRDVRDGKDEDLTAEPEMLRAFRDTWELGIHSYLTYMRDRLLLARELLTESGSCFVQISDENLHHIRELMSEVFGQENYVATITFRKKKMPLGARYLEYFCDYIIFFAKDAKKLKFRKFFKTKNVQGDSKWCFVQLTDGTRRKLSKQEHKDHSLLPKGSRVYLRQLITPAGFNQTGLFPVMIDGKTVHPPKGKSWKTSKLGMDELIKNKRIELSDDNKTLNYIMFLDDYPVTPINSLWSDTSGAHNQRYVVETSPNVITRCILMTTDPGDIVFDPTCGSGTTAYVAEQWARRWITCDTSRVAIALAKQRLMTANFDYYELKSEKEGVSSGFNYKTVPHITLGSIANNEPAKEEVLYDKPKKDGSKIRVTGPFTVEAVPAHKVESLSESSANGLDNLHKEIWLDELRVSGIKAKKGISKDIEFTRLEIINGAEYIYAEGETKEEKPKRVIVCFGSQYAPLEQKQIEKALEEAKAFQPNLVIFCAFQFDPEAGKDVDHLDLKWTEVLKAQMNSDLLTSDLKKKTKGESFWLIGQPDIKIDQKQGKYVVTVEGFDYYNTKTNSVEKGGKNQIAMWMLDTNYDEKSVYPRQVFFPISSSKHDWTKLKKTLKTEIDEELIDKFAGTESIPFDLGSHKKIAVKIIDGRGIESIIVKSLD